MKTKSMFKMSIKTLLAGITLLAITGFITVKSLANVYTSDTEIGNELMIQQFIQSDSTDSVVEIIDSPIVVEDSTITLKHLDVKRNLIAEVDKYISSRTKGKHDSRLAEYIVEHALNYNIDICFMMSQTQIETNYGVAGIGRASSKRSLFGVISRRYTNYNDAVEDYCKILQKSYLVKGRTEKDLMKNYVNKNGHRYAGSKTYEAKLSNQYKVLTNNTKISVLEKEYKYEYQAYLKLKNVEQSCDSTLTT